MVEPGLYVHKKGGVYRVIMNVVNATDSIAGLRAGAPMVVYIPIDPERGAQLHCRTEDEFVELVEWPDGETRARFVPEGYEKRPGKPRLRPVLDPEKMNGYSDQFPGSDFP